MNQEPGGVVDRIYEASVLPELWPGVLRDFAEIADSREAVIVATGGPSLKWIGSSPRMEALTRGFYDYPGGQERTRRLLAARRGEFITDFDVFTQEEMRDEPVFADYLYPEGFGRGVATVINVPSGETIVFHAEGDHRLGPFRPGLLQRLNSLRPHIARSGLVSARLEFERARTAVETLSGIGLAACAVDQAGLVIVANTGFESERSLWTTRGGNRVALTDRRADRQLYQALDMIGAEHGVRSLPVAAPIGGIPAVLHVVPIRRAAHDLFTRAAAILVSTKASDATPATSLLQAMFDLSSTEADVAARISAGRTAEQIALADRKSIDTVRNQVKSVLQKTGCRRQVDLARLLTQLIPPVSQAKPASGASLDEEAGRA
ncbi:helix-turn-helix transcriptional regulator [Mesorhizobium sp. LHD-90]|uniref:helix-turn-helix transcriptional regulator n=1 Tax=Mesorhizobium sp. LHD-90 TaxID=3071414 RepID=UPI0027E1D9E7|nr:helix-turn-helix transcriptional regulator [Mesorhizobium sp. LHD-90]MDQ6432709.1 helix-turn-helix transcriptional regulator [Mesorhizobium sp. LHD-90]